MTGKFLDSELSTKVTSSPSLKVLSQRKQVNALFLQNCFIYFMPLVNWDYIYLIKNFLLNQHHFKELGHVGVLSQGVFVVELKISIVIISVNFCRAL